MRLNEETGIQISQVGEGTPAGRRFAGRVAVVTGASRGIGLAIARRLISEGARVCVTARKPEPLAAAVEQLGGAGVAVGVAGRADDAEHRAHAVRVTLDAFGRLDVLVNNTGINPVYGPMTSADAGAAAKVFDVNVIAALSWTDEARKLGLGSQDGAAIVNVASIAGLRPSPGIGVYGASKAALIHVTSQLALELAPRIRVNAVAPAVVKTRFATALYEGREQEVTDGYPLGRLGDPDDVAAAVAFLASDDASWITGQTLTLDGGVGLAGGLG
ncbi:SDR family oxidoreductase [Kineosporia sp. J2-2]|uniref:SDR family oxidoreductase n=1 Tax=Kineosporia corallincola TaxID=2835133 RepID=A0ABS5TQB4_9ACTN|nr:SDR family oxidoreductase [Kineosporia corallincola]MBT0772228.1 SDR family oxidoreductase [Kineosporia corallincola]